MGIIIGKKLEKEVPVMRAADFTSDATEAVNQTTGPDNVANELPPIALRIYNIIHAQESLWQSNLRWAQGCRFLAPPF